VARLYRALEMIGQISFERKLGCTTDRIDPKRIPENLRAKYLSRYGEGDTLRLPLMATFELLKEMGDEAGMAFFSREKEFKGILHVRNFSILAHGINPVDERKFRKMDRLVRETFSIKERIDFPKLEW